ncbi:GNAT family N-acetyltransferase [Chryseobacterium sp. SSA4.19]|uniref:GNAT family N-acetyltransferase n=1 Tax=Chryseobacterium sp. SSA4.19 TaxID=2919915 RepID=UPI001F4D744A|nr:GNAT family N-acetyltransferase [Chryseobacterium sp. SSA4.19]MCJ8153712.1 GNAT family N-acetyltransferase [Chryseobacterium sp. SSA4.19]
MVSLKFFEEKDFPGVNYTLDETQMGYTSTAEFALKRIFERNTGLEFPVSIFYDEKPSGFFTLDFGADRFDLTDNPNSVLLRSLSVNPGLQEKGIGKSAMLQIDGLIRGNFKSCNEIVLAVNQNNISAYELYLTVGYQYEGKTKIGRNGPQYIMYKKI